MSYLVLSRNGEETFNTFLSSDPDPDPDNISGRQSNEYTILCNNNQVNPRTKIIQPLLLEQQMLIQPSVQFVF